jgi:signal transduction protein with GAF and PtsI domain
MVDVSRKLEDQETLDQGLQELVEITAMVLDTDRCSLMLVEEGEDEGPSVLRVHAHVGDLPEVALQQTMPCDEGIAGHVVRTGQPLLVNDIANSPFADRARQDRAREGGKPQGLVSVPILAEDRVAGVININHPRNGRAFDDGDVELLAVYGLFVGKAIVTFQLHKILQSRFAQLALQREQQDKGRQEGAKFNPDPARLAKIVAKTIYRELTAGGFGANQIISVTSEVINELQKNLDKHRQRRRREDGVA